MELTPYLVHRICISPVLLYAMKYVNVVLCKSVDLVQLGPNATDGPRVVEQVKYNKGQLNFLPQKPALTTILNLFLILTDEKIFCLYYFHAHSLCNHRHSHTTIIHHVYKPDFAVCAPFSHGQKLEPVCHQIGGRARSSFLSGQCIPQCWKIFIIEANIHMLVSSW